MPPGTRGSDKELTSEFFRMSKVGVRGAGAEAAGGTETWLPQGDQEKRDVKNKDVGRIAG